MSRTLGTGKLRVSTIETASEDTMQVGSGVRIDTGDLIVVLRLGSLVFEMTPGGAEDLGRSLVAEANIARAQGGAPS